MLKQDMGPISFLVAFALLLFFSALVHFWPGSYWLDVRSVRVFDARAGEPVLMTVDRTIRHDFQAEWVVSIRRFEPHGIVAYCTARGTVDYQTDSALPDPLKLRWWTYPDCHPLPPGKYTMRTTWNIAGNGLLPSKRVSADAGIFEIRP